MVVILVRGQPDPVGGVDDDAQQLHEAVAVGRIEAGGHGLLAARIDGQQLGQQLLTRVGDGDTVTTAVLLVASADHVPHRLQVIDEPDHVALVQVQAVAQGLLALRTEVTERGEDGEVVGADAQVGHLLGQQSAGVLDQLGGQVAGVPHQRRRSGGAVGPQG